MGEKTRSGLGTVGAAGILGLLRGGRFPAIFRVLEVSLFILALVGLAVSLAACRGVGLPT